LLNVGGDMRICGDLSRTLGIASPWADSESTEPIATIEVKDRAVSTSGSSQRGFEIRGKWYSHIIDPRTGRPSEQVASATVIAPRSADADALATIANVLSLEETLRLASSLPEVDCLIVTSEGQVARTPGWTRHERRSQERHRGDALALADRLIPGADEANSPVQPDGRREEPSTAPATWSREFELVVNFEINSPEGEGRRYRRPYVAIWIENKEGRPIRTLTLWVSMGGSGPFQWIPDLKRWYKADQIRKQTDKKEMVFTIARPTRPPGKYRVIWDGKDDHGKPAPAGEYTLLIDAAREHGTYQNLRKTVTLGDQPFTEELKGDVEIKSATIEYRKKAAARPSH
jgi:hypothetical protein